MGFSELDEHVSWHVLLKKRVTRMSRGSKLLGFALLALIFGLVMVILGFVRDSPRSLHIAEFNHFATEWPAVRTRFTTLLQNEVRIGFHLGEKSSWVLTDALSPTEEGFAFYATAKKHDKTVTKNAAKPLYFATTAVSEGSTKPALADFPNGDVFLSARVSLGYTAAESPKMRVFTVKSTPIREFDSCTTGIISKSTETSQKMCCEVSNIAGGFIYPVKLTQSGVEKSVKTPVVLPEDPLMRTIDDTGVFDVRKVLTVVASDESPWFYYSTLNGLGPILTGYFITAIVFGVMAVGLAIAGLITKVWSKKSLIEDEPMI